jgi:hypothetical protein
VDRRFGGWRHYGAVVPGWASSLLSVVVGAVLGYVLSRVAYRRARRDESNAEARRELDEARRLLLMVAFALRHSSAGSQEIGAELGASVANALCASGLMTTDEAVDFMARVKRQTTKDERDAVLREIDRLIAELDDLFGLVMA